MRARPEITQAVEHLTVIIKIRGEKVLLKYRREVKKLKPFFLLTSTFINTKLCVCFRVSCSLMSLRSCRLRNILETWKVRSPCNVHKHSKHRRTPLYLLELAVRVGRGKATRVVLFPTARRSRHFTVVKSETTRRSAEGPGSRRSKYH